MNSFGSHAQTIIGYDNMGTPNTNDDVCIMMDSFDTTDHNQDGYFIDDFDRLMYGFLSDFEGFEVHNDFLAAFPAEGHEELIEALGAANK